MRRASSLKHINHNLSLATTSPPHLSHYHNQHHRLSVGRPATSASNYNNGQHYSGDHKKSYAKGRIYDDGDDNLDSLSQSSWKSSSALNTKRRTLSMLSVFSSGNSSSRCGSSITRSHSQHQPDPSVLTQFEKQLLHKDLKRNSFRAVSATTKDFVMNPLFEKQQFFNGEGGLKLSIAKPLEGSGLELQQQQQQDDQGGDSGVDSCLNGFSDKVTLDDGSRTKILEDSLIF